MRERYDVDAVAAEGRQVETSERFGEVPSELEVVVAERFGVVDET